MQMEYASNSFLYLLDHSNRSNNRSNILFYFHLMRKSCWNISANSEHSEEAFLHQFIFFIFFVPTSLHFITCDINPSSCPDITSSSAYIWYLNWINCIVNYVSPIFWISCSGRICLMTSSKSHQGRTALNFYLCTTCSDNINK